jgi:hypothetical protein
MGIACQVNGEPRTSYSVKTIGKDFRILIWKIMIKTVIPLVGTRYERNLDGTVELHPI